MELCFFVLRFFFFSILCSLFLCHFVCCSYVSFFTGRVVSGGKQPQNSHSVKACCKMTIFEIFPFFHSALNLCYIFDEEIFLCLAPSLHFVSLIFILIFTSHRFSLSLLTRLLFYFPEKETKSQAETTFSTFEILERSATIFIFLFTQVFP